MEAVQDGVTRPNHQGGSSIYTCGSITATESWMMRDSPARRWKMPSFRMRKNPKFPETNSTVDEPLSGARLRQTASSWKEKATITLLLQGMKHREWGPAPLLPGQLSKCIATCFLARAMPRNCFSFACLTENRSCIYGSGPDNTCQAEGEAAATLGELLSCTDRGQR